MGMIAELVRVLLDAGTPHDVIVKAVAVVEAGQSSKDEAAERRRAKDRERKRAVRGLSADIHDVPRNSADIADPLNVPPDPPITTPTSIPDGMANAAAGAAHPEPDPAEPERQLFERGKQVLGNNAGGMIAKLLKAKGRNVSLARAAIETASTKHKPREYLAGILKGNDFNDKRSNSTAEFMAGFLGEDAGRAQPDWASANYGGPSLDGFAANGGRTSRQ